MQERINQLREALIQVSLMRYKPASKLAVWALNNDRIISETDAEYEHGEVRTSLE